MKKTLFQDKYPVYIFEISKNKNKHKNINSITKTLKEKIQEHPVTTFIAEFDHFTHTKNLEQGIIAKEILDTKNIIFCFGKKIDTPLRLAVRPYSIGITETEKQFIFTFLEGPNPKSNDIICEWIEGLFKTQHQESQIPDHSLQT